MPRFSIQVDGQKVQRMRRDRGWSQVDLADRARLTQKTVSVIETTNRAEPSSIENIAEALRCSVYEFLPRAQRFEVQILRITVDRKIDEARKEVQGWGEWIGGGKPGEWSKEWYYLKHACKYAQEAIEYDPTYTRGWTLLADIYHLTGRRDLAKYCLAKSYEIAMQVGPSPGDFYNKVEDRIRTGRPFKPAGTLERQSPPPGFEDVYQLYWTE